MVNSFLETRDDDNHADVLGLAKFGWGQKLQAVEQNIRINGIHRF